jgi:ADP-ribose pyrophosphatase YjhB (NUDIX family)
MIKAAGVIIEDLNNNVLVLRRKTNVPEGDLLGLPGGKVLSDQKPKEAVLQKMVAETGLKLPKKDLIYVNKFSFFTEDNRIEFYAFKIRIQELSPKINLNTDGHTGYQWISPKELISRNDLMKGMYLIFDYFNKTRLYN